jgi:hypothetical protein
MTFKKGQSGNPGGRPKAEREVTELARDGSPRAIGRLIELVESEDPRAAIAAANAVLDRAYGKPTQPISGDEDRPPVIPTPSVDALAKLSPADRKVIRDVLRKAVGK